jgi:hypothetical protein
VRKGFMRISDVTPESWVTKGEWPDHTLVWVRDRFMFIEIEVYTLSMIYTRAAMPASRVLPEVGDGSPGQRYAPQARLHLQILQAITQ